MSYVVVLKSLKSESERIVLSGPSSKASMEDQRKSWRKILGDKAWTVDRRPGVDTLDHLILKVEKIT